MGALAWMATALPGAGAGFEAPTIELVTTAEATVFEVRGLGPELLARLETEALSEQLEVYTEAAAAIDGLPSLLGGYALVPSGLRFTPRFPLIAGSTYVARWKGVGGELERRFTLARPDATPSTTVAAIYPSATSLPENLLRIYVQFSAPMSRDTAPDHIRLTTGDGATVDRPFVAPERELWSPDRTRLTLFFDPGRIKRGVGPNLDLGPVLERGRRYRLMVEAGFRDARGLPLLGSHAKEFQVVEPDRSQPRTEDWSLRPPSSGADELVLDFPEPLDHGLLHGLLEVLDARGARVPGAVVIDRNETRWSFRPRGGWSSEIYRLRIGTDLEDLAGNSLRRPFEIALDGDASPVPTENETPYIEMPFSISR